MLHSRTVVTFCHRTVTVCHRTVAPRPQTIPHASVLLIYCRRTVAECRTVVFHSRTVVTFYHRTVAVCPRTVASRRTVAPCYPVPEVHAKLDACCHTLLSGARSACKFKMLFVVVAVHAVVVAVRCRHVVCH